MNWAEGHCWDPFKINKKQTHVFTSMNNINHKPSPIENVQEKSGRNNLIYENRLNLFIIDGQFFESSNSKINANHRITKKNGNGNNLKRNRIFMDCILYVITEGFGKISIFTFYIKFD